MAPKNFGMATPLGPISIQVSLYKGIAVESINRLFIRK